MSAYTISEPVSHVNPFWIFRWIVLEGFDIDGLFVVPVDEFLVAEVITADQERRDFSSNDSDYSTIHNPVSGWNVAPLRWVA